MEEQSEGSSGLSNFLRKVVICPKRYIIAFMIIMGVVNNYTLRLCLNMCITRMVEKENISHTGDNAVCEATNEEEKDFRGGEYAWSQQLQGFILSSFYAGYFLSHIPGGLLAEKFGGKIVFLGGILSSTTFVFATPVTIMELGPYALIALRFLMGIGEGFIFPALSVLLAHWIPQRERAIVGAMVLGSTSMGTVASNLGSGFLLEYMHWKWTFYIWGVIALVWAFFFILLVFSDPSSHPYISEEEKNFLKGDITFLTKTEDLPRPPFKNIFTSGPVWAMVLGAFGHDWGFFTLVTNLPKYMNDVLQVTVVKNGIFTALPFSVMFFVIICFGFITDFIVNKEWFRLITIRKMNTAISACIPGICLVCASYAGCSRVIVTTFFCLSCATMGPYYSGVRLAPLDLSPNYAGTLMALSNGIGALAGCLGPIIIGLLTPHTSLHEWRVVFWLAFGVFFLSAILFIIFGTSDVQPWNNGPVQKEKK